MFGNLELFHDLVLALACYTGCLNMKDPKHHLKVANLSSKPLWGPLNLRHTQYTQIIMHEYNIQKITNHVCTLLSLHYLHSHQKSRIRNQGLEQVLVHLEVSVTCNTPCKHRIDLLQGHSPERSVIMRLLRLLVVTPIVILLMAEILHHLGCMKPYK